MANTPAPIAVKLTFGTSAKLVYFCHDHQELLQQRHRATGRWEAVDTETRQKATECKERDDEGKAFAIQKSGEWCMACNGAVQIT